MIQSVRRTPVRQRTRFAIDQPAVLVLDDEERVRRAVARVLRLEDVRVHLAATPDEARALLENIQVQVVISDLNLGRGVEDGISFLETLRGSHPRVQRILLSGAYEIDDVEQAINRAGVHRFMGKPYAPATLIETLRQSVEQWHTAAERDRLLDVTTKQKEALIDLARDLEQKVAQRTALLERASRTWRATFDSIADPMILVDKEFRIRRANTATANHAGDDIRSLIGRHCHEALFGRDDKCRNCPLAGGEVFEPTRGEVDGRKGRLWEVRAWSLTEEGQVADGEASAVCHYHEITESRALQRQVIMLEKLAAIGELAGCVAHELNNPLTGILTFAQIMRRGGADIDEVEGLAIDIEEAARRCSNIVQSLLDFARGGASDPAEIEAVDLRGLIESCVNVAYLQLKNESALKIDFICAPDLTPVRGNITALKSLFLNLINNAVQAMKGEGSIRIQARPIEDHLIEIEVHDSGPGIPEDHLARIFQPFFSTKAKNQEGTGLGLAIVSNVVRDHGGRVNVENAPAGGALFTIELPAAAQ